MAFFFLALFYMFMCFQCYTISAQQCCPDPVNAFILRQFAGPCACQTLHQKWNRYVDWVQLEGGYVHPFIGLTCLNEKRSFERGVVVKIQKDKRKFYPNRPKLRGKDILFQIPISIAFSQFIISKYIKNASKLHLSSDIKPHFYMPNTFPNWDKFRQETGEESIKPWLALGLAWLKEYTHELLPWMELLPKTYSIPFMWSKQQRNKLLKGSFAAKILKLIDEQFESAKPYIDLLGLTEMQVKTAFACIQSRAFKMKFDQIGGAEESFMIPSGVDFMNHDAQIKSTIYGGDRFRFQYDPFIKELVTRHKYGHDVKLRRIDFSSFYYWVDNDVQNNKEIFINYGNEQKSADRMALFGFIDESPVNDFHLISLDLDPTDINLKIKEEYFETVWDSDWSQQNASREYLQSSERESKINKRILHFDYNGEPVIGIPGVFIRFLRLAYLPSEYFDSFTISSILNDFEYDYLDNVIDPLIHIAVNDICKRLLDHYPTTYNADQLKEVGIAKEREYIQMAMHFNANKNATETQRLRDLITGLDMESMVLKYLLREKLVLEKCTRLQLHLSVEYLDSVKR